MKRFAGHDVAMAFWESFMDDARALADEDQFDDWKTLVVIPGDVTPMEPSDEVDLDVLVPGDQFEQLEQWVATEGLGFETAEIYRREKDGVLFVLATFLDEPTATGVLIPLFYVPAMAEEMIESVRNEGRVVIGLRPLSGGQYVTLSHNRPEMFFPELEE